MLKSQVKQIPLRIRKPYFEDIVAGRKRVEYRKACPYWLKMLAEPKRIRVAVFVCGKRVHRRLITSVHQMRTPENFSAQGKKDVPTPVCFAIHLGREIRWCGCSHCNCENEVDHPMEDVCHYCIEVHCEGG